ncbi:hypothetical protein H8356DRAFT_1428834 [Neocallimastix lanati (nom. inval.)]|uniref:G-protein coupled receptors family 1 profile domain-containing protein n=1 Tax=Neocallimastix californiae TaxID=1754190 RepID=A0A1Y2CDA5_9FUNG|nr:hypothetical protein H8356DRAFT_1428834 [Neocallimastix sp. JGI-2020a]ORY45012.1 hypothetical protein LY90DRAFT_509570 [Neocallimastix californiae]|eukprot:ORY45012.1 hypothetical protein LY90DRAFT_509570 [Neocallimastix californiae]
MQKLINLAEGTFNGIVFNDGTFFFNESNSHNMYPDIKFQTSDALQYVIDAYLINMHFPWIFLILILNGKNWYRPINLVLIVHWFLRSTGDLLRNTMQLRTFEPYTYWPFSQKNWYISNAIAHIFWLSGEIVGDWYPLIRTKVVTNNSKKIKIIYFFCIIYNSIKFFGMYTYFMNNPINLKKQVNSDIVSNTKNDIVKYNIVWWSTVVVISITSILYDISIILVLKSHLFNEINGNNLYEKNSFMDKFKQISEFRIIFSMTANLIFLPFVIIFVIFLLYGYKYNNVSNINSDSEIELFRETVLNFNYTFMYMDQILLRSFVNDDQKTTSAFFNISVNNIENNKYKNLDSTKDRVVYDNIAINNSMTSTPSNHKDILEK